MLLGKAGVPFPFPRIPGGFERGQKVQLPGLRSGKKAEPCEQGAKKEEELFHQRQFCLQGWDICGGSEQFFWRSHLTRINHTSEARQKFGGI